MAVPDGDAERDRRPVGLGFAVAGTLFVIPMAREIPLVQTRMKFGLGVGQAAALLTTLHQ